MKENNIPVVTPIELEGGSVVIAIIRCPFCGKKHRHGLGAEGALYGVRVPHCTGEHPPAYDLQPTKEIE